MSECALKSKKYGAVLYNEINPLLPKLIKEAIAGFYNYDNFKAEFISREDFDQKKDSDGYVKYVWSFSNSGNSYLFSRQIEPLKRSIYKLRYMILNAHVIMKNLRGRHTVVTVIILIAVSN